MVRWKDDNKVLSHKIASLETKHLKALSKEGNDNKSQGQDNGRMVWLDLDPSYINEQPDFGGGDSPEQHYPLFEAFKQGLNFLIPHQVIQTLCHQGLDSNWVTTEAAHIKENGPIIRELVQEVTILSQHLAALPLTGPSQPVISTPFPSSAMILEIYWKSMTTYQNYNMK
ncbi:hypothetical protein DSO57_1010825 [Entomophthora muscae]|uniref:Uncharacterized protein n=1 Tax=Entomophthora muscae TaxID=34485 RepID=A0ACC2S8E2_9FUNG|nr:hypothetical protein DSO57_1010825 [Entomophthora muscae]